MLRVGETSLEKTMESSTNSHVSCGEFRTLSIVQIGPETTRDSLCHMLIRLVVVTFKLKPARRACCDGNPTQLVLEAIHEATADHRPGVGQAIARNCRAIRIRRRVRRRAFVRKTSNVAVYRDTYVREIDPNAVSCFFLKKD